VMGVIVMAMCVMAGAMGRLGRIMRGERHSAAPWAGLKPLSAS
jgi:hypothetical protein